MNTLLNIKAFLLVARTGSFSGAARELGVAPSVVTKRITRLEDEMGAQLFVRSTRALALLSAAAGPPAPSGGRPPPAAVPAARGGAGRDHRCGRRDRAGYRRTHPYKGAHHP